MKKFAIALVLFFATNTSIGMEKETNIDEKKEIEGILSFKKNFLSLTNNLSVDKNHLWEIACHIEYKNGDKNTITIKQGKRKELGETTSIAKIRISNNKSNYSFMGRLNPVIYVADTVKTWDDLTSKFLDEIKNYKNDNVLIVVGWELPFDLKDLESYYLYEWNYLFTPDKTSLK